MHLMSAIDYSLISLILFFWSNKEKRTWVRTISIWGCAIILFSALEGIAIHLLPLKSSELALLVPIHLLSAATLIILLSGVVSWGMYLDRIHLIAQDRWLPLVIAGVILSLNIFYISSLMQQKSLIMEQNRELLNRLNNTLIYIISFLSVISTFLSGWIVYLFQKIRDKSFHLEHIKIQLEASKSILEAINQSGSILEASQTISDILYRVYGAEIFVYWEWNPNKKRIELKNYIQKAEIIAPNFEASCREFDSEANALLDGEFFSGKPIWKKDFASGGHVRSSAAKADGIQEALSFPLYRKEQLVGVLELFRKTTFYLPEETWSMALLENIGQQFGLFIERKKIDAIRKELSSIFTYSLDAIYTLDLEYKIKQWNESAELLYGWKEAEVLGKSVLELFPKERRKEFEQLEGFEIEKFFNKRFQTQRLRKDQSLVWVELIYSPIYNEENQLTGVSVISENIEEKIKLEKAKNEFISMITHELRSPLASIIGALGLLRVDKEMSSSARGLIAAACKNADRLQLIANDILDVEKIQLGQFHMRSDPFLLAPVIEEALALSAPFASELKISLSRISNFLPLQIKGDPDRLLQVLLNLISNAIKFSSPNNQVWIEMQKFDSRVRISVTDHGCGISPEFRPHVFEKFARGVDENTQPRGSGLGLHISKNIVLQMGGIIDFTSELNRGSTFYVEFPIYEEK